MAKLDGKILITGGAGFLGRGILRLAHQENWPCSFTVYSRDEHKHQELYRRWPDVNCVLGDIRDRDRLEAVMTGHETVIHAAAMKYVPEGEQNVAEAIAVNLHGSETVATAAWRAGVDTVVGISTDKAVRPVNVYGATKMLDERLFSEASRWGRTRFISVRYGNVVGSTGSVIPLFQRQLAEQGKVLLTDPLMTRFWLSIDEAVNLICWAIAELPSGSVGIPKCGAMKMGDLAKAIAGDAIEVVGARPGEKQHEELVQFEESGRIRERGDYFELLPTGSPAEGEQWTYASHSPARWITVSEMQEMIIDAQDV